MKSTNKTPNGTSYWSNNITATVTQLKAILGEPVFCDNDGSDKVNFEWNLETDNGDVFTVYDWKEYRPISEDEIIVWHIGGINGSVTIQAQSEVNAALTTQPKEPTHITWWKGLNEEEQTKLCQKHFQGIPVDSLMERSIKVMYHYENPETTTNTVTGEIKLWVTGSGVRSENLTANDVLIRTDDATIHLDKDSEFGKLAHAMINRYNSHDSLVSALKEATEDLKNLACNYADYSTNESNPHYIGKLASYAKAKQVLNQINQL